MGTALAGSIMIGVVASSFVAGILASPDIPARVKEQAQVELAGGVPFISDATSRRRSRSSHCWTSWRCFSRNASRRPLSGVPPSRAPDAC
jgi:hypothetical protein